MPLRLVNKERTHAIEACETTFHIISMSIGDKEALVIKIQCVGEEIGAFDRILDIIAPAIARIDGFETSPREVLGQLEDIDDLKDIIHAIIKHCVMSEAEAKNLSSSSEQPTPDSAGNAETPVNPDDEPASTIQTTTDE